MGLDVELFGLGPQLMQMPCVSLKSFLHSLGFPTQKMELNPVPVGQILPSTLTLVS